MIPETRINKVDGNTGVVKPGSEGVLAIIAPSASGDFNLPAGYTRDDLALEDFGHGPLVEFASYVMNVAGRPVLLIRGEADTAGTYGDVELEEEDEEATSVPSAGATVPLDDYLVRILFTNGGTIGTEGIRYKDSLDDGETFGPEKALGTADSITIANSGVTIEFGAGDVVTGEAVLCRTTGPRMSNTNLGAALEALRVTQSAWDSVLIHGEADTTNVAAVQTWLGALETVGKFKTALMNTRLRDDGETEAEYKDDLEALSLGASGISVVVCADGGDVSSFVRGIVLPRPTALVVAARGMKVDIAVEPAFVADGALDAIHIKDDEGNPKFHDEYLYPGLDDLRFTVLRSWDGRPGAYVNNTLLFSPSGSDYVFWPHARVMNKACTIVYQILSSRLSKGVRKNPATGFILEDEASEIEQLVNTALDGQLAQPQRVSGVRFTLSRDDDLTSNAGATLTGKLDLSALAYVKKFEIKARFVKRIEAQAA